LKGFRGGGVSKEGMEAHRIRDNGIIGTTSPIPHTHQGGPLDFQMPSQAPEGFLTSNFGYGLLLINTYT
jgi:hypothetical protein